MILLYTSLIFVLAAAKRLIGWRAKSLEKKYIRVSQEADVLVKQPAYKDGNSTRGDPLASAKRQYLLGHLIQKRDQVEAKYVAWQSRADRVNRYVSNLQAWKGKKLPYTFGAVDVAFLLGTIDYLGFQDYVGVRPLVQFVTKLF